MKTENIITEYVQFIKSEFNKYIELIYNGKYNKEIFDAFIDKYINERYYEIPIKRKLRIPLYKKIINEFKQTEKFLKMRFSEEEVKTMEQIFENLIYFDRIVKNTDIPQKIENIKKIRKEKLEIESKNFEKILENEHKKQYEIKSNFLREYESDYFKLKKDEIDKVNKIFLVKLRHNISFSNMYSNEIINAVFMSGTTSEDKLPVEYNMLELQVLKDIINGNLNRKYIVEFETSVLKKRNKINRIIKLLDNEYLKETIIFLINIEDFNIENKVNIYDLMRKGYKFSIYIDNNAQIDEETMQTLDVFFKIIVETQAYTKYKKQFINQNILKKVIKL